MKKALITGGAGFIGSNLCEFLLKKKYKVNVIDDLSSGNKANLPKKVNFFLGDINNKKVLYKSSRNCSAIFHLAAKSVLQESIKNPYECIKTNILGTSNIIESGINNKSKIIFASSCAVYPLNLNKKLRESDICNAETPYGQSKITCENLINFYISTKKIKGINLRFFNVYGLNQNPQSIYSAVIPKFIKRAKENNELYGSIKPAELSKTIENSKKIEIKPSQIDIGKEIKKIGLYEAKINLHAEIQAKIHIEVVKEEAKV